MEAYRIVALISLSCVIIADIGVASEVNTTTAVVQLNGTINASIISRDHVTIFFDHRVRYHTHEAENAYTKQDLAAMITVISTRFSKLIIDTAPRIPTLPPDDSAPTRIWIPSVVAHHNQDNPASPPMEVIVSFEFDLDPYQDLYQDNHHLTRETSFDVAKFMADSANQIHPGTVKTLMMTMYRTDKLEYADESYDYSYFQYMQDWSSDQDNHELNYFQQIHHLAWPYQLGIFMDVHDCGRYRGPLPDKVKEILQFVDLVGLFIDPTTFHHLTTLSTEESHRMFVAKFEDCEEKLLGAKGDLKVMPSSLWKSNHVTIGDMVEDWKLRSGWAVESGKEVIMYEAFDTPGGRDFYYWGHGWWRLRDRAAYQINETSFVEKIEDANSEIYKKHLYSTSFEDSEEISPPVPSKNCTNSSTATPTIHYHPPPTPTIIQTATTNHAVYIVLVLLSVICTVLIFTHLYFHSKLLQNSSHPPRGSTFRHKTRHSFVNPIPVQEEQSSLTNHHYHENPTSFVHQDATAINDDNDGSASINGSVMEMTDTTPIVSVSYKKL